MVRNFVVGSISFEILECWKVNGDEKGLERWGVEMFVTGEEGKRAGAQS